MTFKSSRGPLLFELRRQYMDNLLRVMMGQNVPIAKMMLREKFIRSLKD